MPVKLFFIIGTLSNGGAERTVSNLTIHLSNNFEKNILLFGEDLEVKYPYEGNIIKMDHSKNKGIINKLRVLFNRYSKVKKIKKNENCIAISFLEYPNLLNVLTSSRGKTIISVRNYMSKKHNKGLKGFLWGLTIKILYKRANEIIAVSREIQNDLISNYSIDSDKINVIYNSYPTKLIFDKSKEKINNHVLESIFNYPVVITAGRLHYQKGHIYLIRAFKEVKKVIPEAKLIILGEGSLKNSLIEATEDLEIKKDVYFLGFQNNPFKFISRSNVFVLSSLYEGFPNAIAEAMVTGVPVISTDCLSGPRELLAPLELGKTSIKYDIDAKRFGILTPAFKKLNQNATESLTTEEKVLAKRIVDVLSNYEIQSYYAKQSTKRVKEFDIENIKKDWEKVINRIALNK